MRCLRLSLACLQHLGKVYSITKVNYNRLLYSMWIVNFKMNSKAKLWDYLWKVWGRKILLKKSIFYRNREKPVNSELRSFKLGNFESTFEEPTTLPAYCFENLLKLNSFWFLHSSPSPKNSWVKGRCLILRRFQLRHHPFSRSIHPRQSCLLQQLSRRK